MPFEKGLPQASLKAWTPISKLDESFLRKINYFCGFQTYLAEDEVRKMSAMFVTTDDEVYAIGHNNGDNLLALEGDDFAKTVEVTEPRKIESLSGKKIKKLSVSERFGAALTEDGSLLYWGMDMKLVRYEEADKKYLQKPHIPDDEVEGDVAMMTCTGHAITYITKGGDLFIWGCINLFYTIFYAFARLEKPEDAVFKSLASGWYHVALVDDQGRAWTMGSGSVGELGYVDTGKLDPTQVELPGKCTKVECGANSTLFLLENGDVYACGNNLQLDHLCVGKDGHIVKPMKVLLGDPITDIMAAYNWSGKHWQSRFAAISSNGEYFKWGEDGKEKVPSRVEDVASLAEMFVNFKTPQEYGNIVRPERDVQNVLPPVVPAANDRTKPNLAGTEATSTNPNPDASATQSVDNGGDSTLNPSNTGTSEPEIPEVPGGLPAQESIDPENKIVPSEPVSVLSEWSIFESLDESFKKQVTHFMVFSAYDHFINEVKLGAFLVTKNDTVYSFGLNTDEKLLGLSGQKAEEFEVEAPTKVDNLSGKKIKKIVVGVHLGVALSDDGSVFVWDQKSPPTLFKIDDETPVDVACGAKFFLVLTNKSNIYLNGELSSKVVEKQKIAIPSGVRMDSIECGDSHAGFVSTIGDAYTFGSGVDGQLGYELNSGTSSEAKKVTLPEPCTKIACGVSSTIFMLKNGDVYACGANSYYDRLGVGHEKKVVLPEKVVIPDRAVDIFACIRQIEPHLRGSTFFVKTATKGFFNWGTQFVASKFELWNVSTMLEAFRGREIPQSMSLIRLDSRDDDSSKFHQPEQELTKSEDQRGKMPIEDGGERNEKGAEENKNVNTPSAEDRNGGPPDLTNVNEGQSKTPDSEGSVLKEEELGVNKDEKSKKDESLETVKDAAENENLTSSKPNDDEKIPTEDASSTSPKGKQDLSRKDASENENPQLLNPSTENGSNEKAAYPLKIEKPTTANAGKVENELDKNTWGDDMSGLQLYSDLTIKLSIGKISVHKVLLYMKSSFFRQALSGDDNIEELDLSSYKAKSVLALLKHIYGVPIGEKATIDDAADFHDFAKKNGTSSLLELSRLLLYSSTLNDVITAHLRQKEIESKDKILEAILPKKAFP